MVHMGFQGAQVRYLAKYTNLMTVETAPQSPEWRAQRLGRTLVVLVSVLEGALLGFADAFGLKAKPEGARGRKQPRRKKPAFGGEI